MVPLMALSATEITVRIWPQWSRNPADQHREPSRA